MAGGKKEVCGRDPRSTDFEARRTGSGWTVTQLPERSSRRAVPLRDGVCTKGPPRIKLRSFASSGRWSRASMRPIFDRDSSISPFLSLCTALHPVSTGTFYNGEFEFFFTFFDSIGDSRNWTTGKGEKKLSRRGDALLSFSPSIFSIEFHFLFFDSIGEELKTLEAIIGKEEIGDKKKCKSVFEWRKERNQI